MSTPITPAGRLIIVHELLRDYWIDTNGDIVPREPLITVEQALEILETVFE